MMMELEPYDLMNVILILVLPKRVRIQSVDVANS